jgi:hypothetical protein
MPLIKFTDDPVVKKLRWVMVAAILFSMVNTLAGQPARFWLNPEKAIRGDGLRLHNPLNHTFEFCLGLGWQTYLLSCLIYVALALLTVSILPRMAALIACLSAIFGHYFGACNWLAVRWHLGFVGIGGYGMLLSAAIVWTFSPMLHQTGRQVIKRLRWVMLVAMLLDQLITLRGQPDSYWANPQTVHEANELWRWFLVQA